MPSSATRSGRAARNEILASTRTSPGSVDRPSWSFALAIFSGNTFSCLSSREDRTHALRNLHGLLRQGGKLLIVQVAPEYWMSLVREGWHEGDRITVPETGVTFQLNSCTRVDRDTMHILSDFKMVIEQPDGQRDLREATSAESIISRNELVECLTQGGYQVIEQWGEYDRRPYCADSKRIIVLAERGDKEEQDKGQPAGAGVLPEARIRAHR